MQLRKPTGMSRERALKALTVVGLTRNGNAADISDRIRYDLCPTRRTNLHPLPS